MQSVGVSEPVKFLTNETPLFVFSSQSQSHKFPDLPCVFCCLFFIFTGIKRRTDEKKLASNC